MADRRAAIAVFRGPRVHGTVRFDQRSATSGVTVHVQLDGLVPYTRHAMHVHEYGYFDHNMPAHKCCEAAGGHWNPYGAPHGSKRLDGDDAARRHAGDLCNNLDAADGDGRVRMTFYDRLVTLFGDASVYGCSVVLHDGVDDEGRGLPRDSSLVTGNAGGRLACAPIVRCAPPPDETKPNLHTVRLHQLFGGDSSSVPARVVNEQQ